MTPAKVRARFCQVVARGIAKAEEQEREHLARLRAGREPRRRGRRATFARPIKTGAPR